MNDPLSRDQHLHAMPGPASTPSNSNPDERSTKPDGLPVGTLSPYQVTLIPPSSLRMLEEMEERWYQRYDKREKELQADLNDRLMESHDVWFKRCEEQQSQIREKSCEIARVIGTALYEKNDRLMFEENFNLRGSLDQLVYHAQLLGKIRPDCPPSVPVGLRELAQTPEFLKLLEHEAVAFQLNLNEVTPAIALVYDAASKYSKGNDVVITLYEENYTRPVCAVLAAFLQLQSTWSYGFIWRRVKGGAITNY